MKKAFLALTILLSSLAIAQRHELGLFLGGANGITDIGRTNYIYPVPQNIGRGTQLIIPFSLGGIYRFNLDPQIGLRANALISKIIGNDFNAAEDYRAERGLNYDNNIYEVSLVLEYNFFDFNTIQKSAHTPFVFLGGGVFGSKQREYTINHSLPTNAEGVELPLNAAGDNFVSTLIPEEELTFNFAIPFGAGYKFKYNWNWVLSLEVGMRSTNSDRLDFSNPSRDDFSVDIPTELSSDPNFNMNLVDQRSANLIDTRQTGDISDNDWYVLTGISLTYTFGRPPCYCN